MRRLRRLSRGGRLVLALAVGGALFGIATAVQASIPSANGVIHGCYGKPGTPTRASNAASTRTRSTGTRPGQQVQPQQPDRPGQLGRRGRLGRRLMAGTEATVVRCRPVAHSLTSQG
jgi:hypothetical protein